MDGDLSITVVYDNNPYKEGLEWASRGKIEKIILAFEKVGVCYVGPSHCSGEKCRGLCQKHFAKNYINVGTGKTITMADLQ